MAKMFGQTITDFLARCISCGLPGYGRVFTGNTPQWGNASIANIIQHAKSEVEGYAVKLTSEEVSKLDKSIGYPVLYNKLTVSLKRLPHSEGQPLIEGLVYVIVDKNLLSKYKRPTPEYLEATSKTLSASLYLRNGAYEDNKHELKINVFNQTNMSRDLVHECFASMRYLGV